MTNRITVAQLVLSLELGGLERLVVNFLSTIDRERFDIALGCLEGPGPLAAAVESLGISVTTFDRRPGIDWRLIPRIARWLKRSNADLLHTHNAAAHFYGALGGRLASTRCTIHTKHGRDWPDQPRKVLLNRVSALFTRTLVAVSDDGREIARRVERVPERKLRVIHNGIDTGLFTPGSARAAAAPFAGVPANAPVIATVARLSPEKDQQTLLEAFAGLCKIREDCRLIIAGEGPARAALEARADSLSCRDRIIFAGAVERVPELLKRVDVFVLTSLSEGISLSLLEAGATGIPAVVSDAGGNAEVVEDGVTGFVVPVRRPDVVAEKIARLLSDEPLRASMGRRARERIVDHFSLARMTRRYEALYRECYDG